MLSRRGRSASPGEPLHSEGVPCIETPKGRKKFTFKEPEIMGFLGFRRMSLLGGSRPPKVRSKSLQPPQRQPQEQQQNGRSKELEELESQAMRVVRTVGQAFEVCHKLSLNNPAGAEEQQRNGSVDKDRVSGDGEQQRRNDDDTFDDEFASLRQPSPSSVHKDILLLGDAEDSILDQPCPTSNTGQTTICPASPLRQSPLGNAVSEQLMNGELTALKHEIQLLRERLDQQSQQTRAASAHARLLQDQLAAETAARVEAQARTHQLLVQNKELLEHIAALVSHLREHERISGVPLSAAQPGQVTGPNNQGTTVADISGLGQYNPAWDHPHIGIYPHYSPLEPPGSPYYPNYSRPPSANGFVGFEEQQLRYQNQLWENLRAAASPYSTASLYQAPPTPPHFYGPAFTLPPSGRPRSVQPPASPSSTLPRPSRLPRSTSYQPQSPASPRSRSLERPRRASSESTQEATFIKPLPCNCPRGSHPTATPQPPRKNLHELMRPLVLDPPPLGKNCGSKAVQTEPWSNKCPVIMLTESIDRNGEGSMPKIVESEDERLDDDADLPLLMRRNSQ